MKTKIKIITFSRHAILSKDNMLSIIDIFDQISIKKFPGGIPFAVFVAAVETEPDRNHVFSLRGELDGKVIFPEIKIPADVGNAGNHNLILNLAGMGFPKAGFYKFILSEKGEDLASTRLEVKEGSNGQKLAN